jgi:hypothetical protein
MGLSANVRFSPDSDRRADITRHLKGANKCPPHSFTSSASANGIGGAVMFGCNASER